MIFSSNISLDNFFTPRFTNLATTEGWTEVVCVLISSLIGYQCTSFYYFILWLIYMLYYIDLGFYLSLWRNQKNV
jgi:hypothetical protein